MSSRAANVRAIAHRFDREAVEARGERMNSAQLAIALEEVIHAFVEKGAKPLELAELLRHRGVGHFAAASIAAIHEKLTIGT